MEDAAHITKTMKSYNTSFMYIHNMQTNAEFYLPTTVVGRFVFAGAEIETSQSVLFTVWKKKTENILKN